MIRLKVALMLTLVLSVAALVAPNADVKTQEKSQIKFEGILGRVVGLFGGKAAKEGIVSSVAVKGDRKATTNDNTGQIIDLAEEKVYDLDVRGKSYKVTTFAELRRRMQEAQAKAEEQARKSEPRKRDASEKEYEVDFNVKETGQSRSVSGYDCREAITTITVREKGKTLEQSGGIVLTADSWLTPKVPGLAEVMAFNRRYAEKLMGTTMIGAAEQMATAMAMWPGLKQALAKYQAEGAKVSGTPLATTLTIDGVKSQEQAAQQAKEDDQSGGGGLLGGLGRRIGKKKSDEGGDSGSKTRSTILTMDHEVLSVSTSVAPADVAIPAGFKEK